MSEELLRAAEAVSVKLQVELKLKEDAMNELVQKETANAMQIISVQKELEKIKLQNSEKDEVLNQYGDINTELQMLKEEKDVSLLFSASVLSFFFIQLGHL